LIQNIAARFITGKKKAGVNTPVLAPLHWLHARFHIDFKILRLTFKAVNGPTPKYISHLLTWYVPSRPLRSADTALLFPDYSL